MTLGAFFNIPLAVFPGQLGWWVPEEPYDRIDITDQDQEKIWQQKQKGPVPVMGMVWYCTIVLR